MIIRTYKGCQECLMVACCSQVCKPYIQEVLEKYNITINTKLSLDDAEKSIVEFGEYWENNITTVQICRDDHGELIAKLYMDMKLTLQHTI